MDARGAIFGAILLWTPKRTRLGADFEKYWTKSEKLSQPMLAAAKSIVAISERFQILQHGSSLCIC
jgi:hypothetical protein